jgi:hypothetical protein
MRGVLLVLVLGTCAAMVLAQAGCGSSFVSEVVDHRAGAGAEEQRAGGRLEDERRIQRRMVTGRGGKGMGARV